jgi:hypothetical protein
MEVVPSTLHFMQPNLDMHLPFASAARRRFVFISLSSLSLRSRAFVQATPNDEPLAKITKIAIGVEGGAQTETEASYEYELEAECLSCNVKLDRNSPQVRFAVARARRACSR